MSIGLPSVGCCPVRSLSGRASVRQATVCRGSVRLAIVRSSYCPDTVYFCKLKTSKNIEIKHILHFVAHFLVFETFSASCLSGFASSLITCFSNRILSLRRFTAIEILKWVILFFVLFKKTIFIFLNIFHI